MRTDGIVTTLQAGRSGVRNPVRARRFSSLHSVETGSGAHLALHSIGTVVLAPGVKLSRREVDHSLPSCAEVKNDWCYTFSAPLYFHNVDSENFIFYLNLESTGK
jgi:hypothetical protein